MSASRQRAPNEQWSEQATSKRIKTEDQPYNQSINQTANQSTNPAPSKKRRWGDTTTSVQPVKTEPAAPPINQSDDKRSVIERQKALIAERIRLAEAAKNGSSTNQSSINQSSDHSISQSAKSLSSWIPLRLDASGRQIDEHGQVITFTKIEPQAKANQPLNQSISQSTKQAAAKQSNNQPAKAKPSLPSYIDPNLPVIHRDHEQREISFVPYGANMARAATYRQKLLDAELNGAKQNEQKLRYYAKEAELARDHYILKPVDGEDIPDVDWWDQVILDPTDSNHQSINEVKITPLIYHPVPIASLTSSEAGPLAVILTAAERKKLARRAKLEKQRDEAERIRLGLQQPPPPKLRISNLMNVLINENISDPSEAERKVRAAMEARQQKHFADNEARKLTPEQKQAKLERKFKQDLSGGCHAALFLCPDLTFGALRYRIDVNARQWNLTGLAIIVNSGAKGTPIEQLKAGALNGVYVEGGKKGIQRMTRLLTHRINWQQMIDTYHEQNQGEKGTDEMKDEARAESEDDSDDEDDSESSSRALNAELLWRGMLPKPVCTGFAFEASSTDSRARDAFNKRGIPSFFDLIKFTSMEKIKKYDEEHKDEQTNLVCCQVA